MQIHDMEYYIIKCIDLVCDTSHIDNSKKDNNI
jgi:hypothetical protein